MACCLRLLLLFLCSAEKLWQAYLHEWSGLG
jgi:hypothetical protein